ncbi:50S ribosomal protein L24P [Salinarchaeum sp. Harcht-Bsk1]|uniref:50S ribosomal protein L24 n=1 Tax=Salinarchaeum sp. Harcht-Bsk1 TaxID=1333523 RepID=UPI0003423444|nr:50S ribosomal protein L24 [Salinarchaeum sp. Harcht-Bsk1]AGN02177.1 50S ribosomal protein L24P [Salinarchaeum sp. Harcht-Bsk1]
MSKQPRTQRNQTANADLHERHDQVRSTLADDLREEYGTRRVRVNQGDTVEVMRGDFAGESGEVLRVDLKDAVVHVEDVTVETADGEEVPRPLDASNLKVTGLEVDRDPERESRIRGEDEA